MSSIFFVLLPFFFKLDFVIAKTTYPLLYIPRVFLPTKPNKVVGEYFISLQVGTPPQPLLALPDTEHSDSWLPTQDCKKCDDVFNTTESSSYKSSEIPKEIKYNLGVNNATVKGKSGEDIFALIGEGISHNFAAVTSVTGTIPQSISINFGGLGLNKKSSLIADLISQEKISKFIIGIKLSSTNPEITFGGFNEDLIKPGSLNYIKAIENSSKWDLSIHRLSYGENAIGLNSVASITLHYPYMVVGKEVAAFMMLVFTQEHKECYVDKDNYRIKCHVATPDPEEFQPFVFCFDDAGKGDPCINITWKEYLEFTSESYGYMAWTSIQVCNELKNEILLGTDFLKSRYLILDEENRRIGFAEYSIRDKVRTDWKWTMGITTTLLITIIVAEALVAKRGLTK